MPSNRSHSMTLGLDDALGIELLPEKFPELVGRLRAPDRGRERLRELRTQRIGQHVVLSQAVGGVADVPADLVAVRPHRQEQLAVVHHPDGDDRRQQPPGELGADLEHSAAARRDRPARVRRDGEQPAILGLAHPALNRISRRAARTPERSTGVLLGTPLSRTATAA
jgi:hypothetical protein